jgi:hypothetical protein
MEPILRFNGTSEHDPAVDAWLASRAEPLGAIARHWFERLRDCGDDVREVMHDGCPTACIDDAGFAYVNVFRAHVNVGFFQGAGLHDPKRLLQGTGKRMRHVKLGPDRELDAPALSALVAAAYVDIKRRLGRG